MLFADLYLIVYFHRIQRSFIHNNTIERNMTSCCVYGCNHRRGIQMCVFYSIPRVIRDQDKFTFELTTERRESFKQALRRNLGDKDRICGCHFINQQPAKLQDRFNPDWIPSLNLGFTLHKPRTLDKFIISKKSEQKMKAFIPGKKSLLTDTCNIENTKKTKLEDDDVELLYEVKLDTTSSKEGAIAEVLECKVDPEFLVLTIHTTDTSCQTDLSMADIEELERNRC